MPGTDVDVAADHNAFVSPWVVQRGKVPTDTTAHINQLTRHQVAADADLLIGLDSDFRVASKVAHCAAQVVACGVVVVKHLATGDHLAHQPGILLGIDFEHPIRIGYRQQGSCRQAHANAIAVGPARDIDQLTGANACTHLNHVAAQAQGFNAQIKLTRGFDAHGGQLVSPGDGFTRQSASTIEALEHTAT